jgi:hypothetical protein
MVMSAYEQIIICTPSTVEASHTPAALAVGVSRT